MALPKRIIKETERLMAEPYVCQSEDTHFWSLTEVNSVPGIEAIPHEDNLRYFDVKIHGPSQSPYEGTCPQPMRLPMLSFPDTPFRWHLQARALPARRLPHDTTQDPLPHQDLPPQHRSPR